MTGKESTHSADIRKRYSAFLKQRRNAFHTDLVGADYYNSIYEDAYGTSDLMRWYEERYSDCQERYDRENPA